MLSSRTGFALRKGALQQSKTCRQSSSPSVGGRRPRVRSMAQAAIPAGRAAPAVQQQPQQQYFLLADARSRSFSTNNTLLGHSPMAAPYGGGGGHDARHIPTQSEAAVGGVWQATTAKRDKLAELKTEASHVQHDLDRMAAAVPRQLSDLHLADGLHVCAAFAEKQAGLVVAAGEEQEQQRQQYAAVLDELVESIHQKAAAANSAVLHQVQWEELLQTVQTLLERALSLSAGSSSSSNNSSSNATATTAPCWQTVRDWYDAADDVAQDETDAVYKAWILQQQEQQQQERQQRQQDTSGPFAKAEPSSSSSSSSLVRLADDFAVAELRVRLHTALGLVQHLQANWKLWTAATDQDVDRAATQQRTAAPATTLPTPKLLAVLDAFLLGQHRTGNASRTSHAHGNATTPTTTNHRLEALWQLMDKDDDGLLDEVEMQAVVAACVIPLQAALPRVLSEALEASDAAKQQQRQQQQQRTGWRQRRRLRKETKALTKLMQKCVERHLVDELEMPHRIRCTYAWANKAHQDNKVDSVLVEAAGAGGAQDGGGGDGGGGGVGIATSVLGRKRYVELAPKISLSEFREVQTVHFPQLDAVGSELVRAFREDLWVAQGKGRQNKELYRDCTLFLVAVSVLDAVILSL